MEKPGLDQKWAFTTVDELLEILNPAVKGRGSDAIKNNGKVSTPDLKLIQGG